MSGNERCRTLKYFLNLLRYFAKKEINCSQKIFLYLRRDDKYKIFCYLIISFILNENKNIPLLNETQKIERENVSDTLKVSDTYNNKITTY